MSSQQHDEQRGIERYRSYLLLLARMQLEARPRSKIDPSDIVQQTMLEAHAKQGQFAGDGAGLAAWLRKSLANNLKDALRALRRDSRDIARERSLEAAVEHSSAQLAGWLAAGHSSPSQRAVRNEDLLRLAAALQQLPEPQREAVVLHHLQGSAAGRSRPPPGSQRAGGRRPVASWPEEAP